jgi:hypothetical protein
MGEAIIEVGDWQLARSNVFSAAMAEHAADDC